jgi:hypothetical protein
VREKFQRITFFGYQEEPLYQTSLSLMVQTQLVISVYPIPLSALMMTLIALILSKEYQLKKMLGLMTLPEVLQIIGGSLLFKSLTIFSLMLVNFSFVFKILA